MQPNNTYKIEYDNGDIDFNISTKYISINESYLDSIINYDSIIIKVKDEEEYNAIQARVFSKLVKSILELSDEFTLLPEFVKIDIDKNDELLFKLLILCMNGLIFLGEFFWKRYD